MGQKIKAINAFHPSIDLEGSLSISFRTDSVSANGLNMPGTFSGRIINRENIGRTSEELVTIWNTHYPEDLVEFSQN